MVACLNPQVFNHKSEGMGSLIPEEMDFALTDVDDWHFQVICSVKFTQHSPSQDPLCWSHMMRCILYTLPLKWIVMPLRSPLVHMHVESPTGFYFLICDKAFSSLLEWGSYIDRMA